jgi:hypothetical protein
VDKETIDKVVSGVECTLFVSGDLELNSSAFSVMSRSPLFFHYRDGLKEPKDWKSGDKVKVETDVTVRYGMHNGSAAMVKGIWEGRPTHEGFKEGV